MDINQFNRSFNNEIILNTITNNSIEIRKEFNFNNAHIVRNCSSDRCKYTAHAHTYHVEVFLKSDKLDNGKMAVDFGLLKGTMKSIIKIFDNAYTLWDKESQKYKDFVYKNFTNVIEVPFSPSAEEYSIFFYNVLKFLIERCTKFNNGEGNIIITKVIVHETSTGYSIADQNSAFISNNTLYDYLDKLKFNFECDGKKIIEKLSLMNDPYKDKFINIKPAQQIVID